MPDLDAKFAEDKANLYSLWEGQIYDCEYKIQNRISILSNKSLATKTLPCSPCLWWVTAKVRTLKQVYQQMRKSYRAINPFLLMNDFITSLST